MAAEFDAASEASADGRVTFTLGRIAEERAAAEQRRAGGAARIIHVGEQAFAFSSAR